MANFACNVREQTLFKHRAWITNQKHGALNIIQKTCGFLAKKIKPTDSVLFVKITFWTSHLRLHVARRTHDSRGTVRTSQSFTSRKLLLQDFFWETVKRVEKQMWEPVRPSDSPPDSLLQRQTAVCFFSCLLYVILFAVGISFFLFKSSHFWARSTLSAL